MVCLSVYTLGSCSPTNTILPELLSLLKSMSLEEVPDDAPSGMLQSLSLVNGHGTSSNPTPLESDVASVEEWDANSVIASDSEMGVAGSP